MRRDGEKKDDEREEVRHEVEGRGEVASGRGAVTGKEGT